MKVAIFGITADPLTSAHLEIIDYLSKNYDKVIVVPTTVRYYKKNICMFSFNERYERIIEKTKKYSNVKISDIERNVPDSWRYFNTLEKIKEEYPNDELFTVMGSDEFNNFQNWTGFTRIMGLSKIIVIDRPGYPIEEKMTAYNFEEVTCIHNDISSTAIREKLSRIMEDDEFEEYLMDVGWDFREEAVGE